MIKKVDGRILFFFLLAIGFIITACGTLEVGMEPSGSLTDPVEVVTQTAVVTEAETPATLTMEATQAPTFEATVALTEPTADEESQDEPTPVAGTPSEITTLDETWSKYTNQQLGFSINFPGTMVHLFGSCTWNEEEESYRPELSFVPVEIFEDGDVVYISSAYYHELTGPIKKTDAEGGTRTTFSECQAVENSLLLLGDPENPYQAKWEIVAAEVHDDEELDVFLKSRYGAGCTLGEKVMSGQDGVYDIRIQGDGKDMSETLCPLNYGTVVKYYPVGNKVIAWDTGQSVTFSADVSYSVTHDEEMIDSFRFLTER